MVERIKGVIYIGILILIVVCVYNYLDSKNLLNISSNTVKLLNKNFDYLYILNNNSSLKIDIKDFILGNNINFRDTNKKNENVVNVLNEEKIDENNPIVYIYNTHNKEKYYYSKHQAYNIIPTVVTVSYMLKEQLKKYDIESIVEERRVDLVLDKNKWNYASSYKVSRMFLEDSKINNPTLNYFIDIHRDSVKKDITTIKIDDITYARVLFILGLENKNYKKNLKMIEFINTKLNKEYPKLSRGIYKKKGSKVNGVYNQDFSENCILIEFGGEENTITEVSNTVSIISKILKEYIGDENE